MKERLTQVLLAMVCVLLAAQLFRGPQRQFARADEAGEVPAVLRARMIELVGQQGEVRSRLKVEPGGEVVFRLMDQAGTIRVKLGAGKDGSGLLLANDATEPGIHLLAKDAGSSLKLRNKDGQERLIKP